MIEQRFIAVGLVVAVVIAWCYLLLKSDNDPVALRKLVGCYASRESVQPSILRVLASGKLVFGANAVGVTGYSDKVGDSLLPERKLTIVPETSLKVRLGRGYPLLIRSNDQDQSLTIPSESGYEVVFTRRHC